MASLLFFFLLRQYSSNSSILRIGMPSTLMMRSKFSNPEEDASELIDESDVEVEIEEESENDG